MNAGNPGKGGGTDLTEQTGNLEDTATSTSMYNCYCNKVYDATAEARGVLSGILIYLIGFIIREINYQII